MHTNDMETFRKQLLEQSVFVYWSYHKQTELVNI